MRRGGFLNVPPRVNTKALQRSDTVVTNTGPSQFTVAEVSTLRTDVMRRVLSYLAIFESRSLARLIKRAAATGFSLRQPAFSLARPSVVRF